MSLKRIFSLLTVALSVAAVGFAQDAKPRAAMPEKAEKRMMKGMKHDGMKRGGGGHAGKRGGGFHGLRGVDLSDAQKAQIKSIREANRPDDATIKEIRAIREVRKSGTEPTQEQKDRMKALRERSRAKMESVHQQVLGVLTADQKATIEKRKAEMKPRREGFRQKREEFRKNRPAKPAATTETPKVG